MYPPIFNQISTSCARWETFIGRCVDGFIWGFFSYLGRIDPFKDHNAYDFGNIFNLTSFCVCKYNLVNIIIILLIYKKSANKLYKNVCSQAVDKLCSHCLFQVVGASLEQAVDVVTSLIGLPGLLHACSNKTNAVMI